MTVALWWREASASQARQVEGFAAQAHVAQRRESQRGWAAAKTVRTVAKSVTVE